MDILFALWIFDSRWFFNIKSKYQQLMLLIPFVIDLLTAVGMAIEKFNQFCPQKFYLVENIVVLLLLCICHIFIIGWITYNTHSKITKVRQNTQQINDFVHHYQYKRIFWGWTGFILISLNFILLLLLLITNEQNECSSISNSIRLYMQAVPWIYSLILLLLIAVVKGIYLLLAWKFPERYLRMREIIISS